MERAPYSAAMTRTFSLAALTVALLAATPALAQAMYPGQGITVNTGAINGSAYGSPYGSPYARGAYPEIIHLHMPVVHHHHVAAKPKPVAPTVAATPPPAEMQTPPAPASAAPTNSPYPPPLDSLTPTDTAPPPAKPSRHSHVHAAAAPPPATDDSSTGQDAALPLTLDPQNDHPVAQPPKHRHSASAANPAQVASTDTGNTAIIPTIATPGSKSALSKRSEILFARGDSDVSSPTVDKMRTVAAELNTLLGAGAQGVQLNAYGGPPGDKSSDSRRISLKRALGIRQLLIEDGVPSERIDVHALGGIDDHGAPDRVDVLVRG